MLMRWSPGYRHANQLKLFHPRQKTPQWQGLPSEVRRSATKLLALMLRRHAAGRPVPDNAQGTSDE
jgi:hypothetical protein